MDAKNGEEALIAKGLSTDLAVEVAKVEISSALCLIF